MDEETRFEQRSWAQPKYILMALGIIVFGAIVIVSILRDRIVDTTKNQVEVIGEGKVSYKSDIANVSLGVHIDKAPTSQDAISQLNEKMTSVLAAIEKLGVAKEDITTQDYSLDPQYDYSNGAQTLSGYNADQKLTVKVRDIQSDSQKVGNVISAASQAGSNQMLGVSFDASNPNDLKQQARLLAIADARTKSSALAAAAGVKLGQVTSWHENFTQLPSPVQFAGALGASDKAVAPTAEIPSGTQDITVEISLTYDVK